MATPLYYLLGLGFYLGTCAVLGHFDVVAAAGAASALLLGGSLGSAMVRSPLFNVLLYLFGALLLFLGLLGAIVIPMVVRHG